MWQAGPSSLDVFIPRGSDSLFTTLLRDSGVDYVDTLLSEDLLRSPPRAGQVSSWDLSSLSNSTFHTAYHSIDEIGTFVKDLLDLYPNQVRLVPIGHSSQNREMYALEITADASSTRKKSGFVITGAQHAREVRYILFFVESCVSLYNSGLPLPRQCSLHTLCLQNHRNPTQCLRSLTYSYAIITYRGSRPFNSSLSLYRTFT